MENASKALLMAAGVLIGILILSLAVYLFVSFGSTSASLHKETARQQIEQFNAQFTSYEGRACTIYDIVTIANLATETNKYYEFERKTANGNDNYISVIYGNKGDIAYGFSDDVNIITARYNNLISEQINTISNGKLDTYNCNVKTSPTTGRVYLVTFTK